MNERSKIAHRASSSSYREERGERLVRKKRRVRPGFDPSTLGAVRLNRFK